MKFQDMAEISSADTIGLLQARLIGVAYGMEFDLVNLAVFEDGTAGRASRAITLGNTPKAFLESSRDSSQAQRDPVLRRLWRDSIPFTYDQQTYHQAGGSDLWEEQAQYGYRTGISAALHLPNGRHLFIGLDRDTSLPKDDSLILRWLADLHLIAVHANHCLGNLESENDSPAQELYLTAREREIFSYVAEGKSSAAIAVLVGMSVGGVNYHIENVKSRLNCSSRVQALLKVVEHKLL